MRFRPEITAKDRRVTISMPAPGRLGFGRALPLTMIAAAMLLPQTASGQVGGALRGAASRLADRTSASQSADSNNSQSNTPAMLAQIIGHWQLGKNDWISFSQPDDSGISGREILQSNETSDLRPSGTTFIFDPALSTGSLLKGVQAHASGNIYNVEIHPGSTPDTLRLQVTSEDRVLTQFLRRVPNVGAQAGLSTVREILQSQPKVWETPIGRFSLIDQGRYFNIVVFDPVTNARKFIMRTVGSLDSVYAGNITAWEWILENESWTNAANQQLMLTFDPTGRRIYAGGGDRGKTPGNLRFWVASPFGAQVPAGQSPQQPAPQQPAPQQPQPQQPAPQQPAPQVPQVPAQNPAPVAAAFKPLNRVDVRVDRVIVARGYPTHQVHVFVTMKNTSASPQYHTGWLKVVLADADGVSWERSQPYMASREPAALFPETPVIQPGGVLRSRYVFTPPEDAQFTTVTLSEGGKSAVFPVSLQR